MDSANDDIITKPKPVKRILTDKQKEAFARCVEARKQKYEERKDGKIEEEVNTNLKKLEEKAEKLKSKLKPSRKEELSEEEETPEIIVVRSQVARKPRRKIVVVEESESEDDAPVGPRLGRVSKKNTGSPSETKNICFC